MSKITEGQYVLGALTIFALWIFVVPPIPILSKAGSPTEPTATRL
jgi:hypothetical protein